MALIASRVMQRAWRETGNMIDITATGGSTTTVVDANSRYTTTNALLNGTVIVTRDAGGAGAAPEGEFGLISAFVSGTKTFTMAALTTAVASGDSIGLVRSVIPATQMLQAVNDGIQDLGYIALVDTSITIVASQYEYDLPVGLKYDEPFDILLQGNTTLATANQYFSILPFCTIFPASPGSAGMLEVRGMPTGRKLKIVYKGVHPAITAFSSVISETISEKVAVAAAIDKALTWLVSKRGESAINSILLQRWNDAKDQLSAAKIDVPIQKERKKPKFFSVRGLDHKDRPPTPFIIT